MVRKHNAARTSILKVRARLKLKDYQNPPRVTQEAHGTLIFFARFSILMVIEKFVFML